MAQNGTPENYLFTSESVTEGHPDKICDQISDAILDEILRQEIDLSAKGYVSPSGVAANVANAHAAIETFTTTGLICVCGEIRTVADLNIDAIAREVVDSIGYNDASYGFDCHTCAVINAVHGQSPDIAQGVDEAYDVQQALKDGTDKYDLTGAGDQGMMFGYASNETKTLMPMPIYMAHRLAERLTEVRKNGTLPYLRPDGKTQVTIKYVNGKPVGATTVLISSQHADGVDIQGQMKPDLIENVIKPVFEKEGVPFGDDVEVLVNPTGRFVVGGPMGDTGLTGRKIIVDTYGGMGRHGGGAFSGKDCTKVDRSAAYAARWIAKNIVAAGIAEKCEVELAYAIGVARPLSVFVEDFGTSKYTHEQLADAVQKVFDLRPAAIVDTLQLRRPIYRLTCNYGHFGRELPEFTWEKTDKVDELKAALGE
ncbi:MAG: methionine adenosyltransferase [Coriobacteriales bacterium]|jgi:S-adenosylmethionine synthetase